MIDSIQHRRSIRKFTDKLIDPDKLQIVLEAARLAPSGNNKQPWTFIVVQDEQRRRAVMEVCHEQSWMMSAPVFIVAVADMAENLVSFIMLLQPVSFLDLWVYPYSSFAVIKFALFALTYLWSALAAFALLFMLAARAFEHLSNRTAVHH